MERTITPGKRRTPAADGPDCKKFGAARSGGQGNPHGNRHQADCNVGGFTSGQKQFLDFHRNAVLLQSIRT